MYAIHQDSSPINIISYKNVQLVICAILVSLILCRMYLYAHKSRFNVGDKYVTSLGRLIVTSLHCKT